MAGQVRETGLTRPALVFDGRCDNLFSDAELTSATGGGSPALVANGFDEYWDGNERMLAQYGALQCTWSSRDAVIIALVLPEGAVAYTPYDRPCGPSHDAQMSCAMETVTNGMRLSGRVALGVHPAKTSAARDALVTVFEAKAAQLTPVAVPLAAPGSWQLFPDCAAVVSGGDFSAVRGLGAGTVDDSGWGPSHDVSQAEAELDPSGLSCGVKGESANVPFVAVGGARWREEHIAGRSGATPLSLKGVDAAYGFPDTHNGRTFVYAFSGPNMLLFEVRYTSNAAGIATALIASLNATAVS